MKASPPTRTCVCVCVCKTLHLYVSLHECACPPRWLLLICFLQFISLILHLHASCSRFTKDNPSLLLVVTLLNKARFIKLKLKSRNDCVCNSKSIVHSLTALAGVCVFFFCVCVVFGVTFVQSLHSVYWTQKVTYQFLNYLSKFFKL